MLPYMLNVSVMCQNCWSLEHAGSTFTNHIMLACMLSVLGMHGVQIRCWRRPQRPQVPAAPPPAAPLGAPAAAPKPAEAAAEHLKRPVLPPEQPDKQVLEQQPVLPPQPLPPAQPPPPLQQPPGSTNVENAL